jgi:hypothetical protein
VFRQISARGGLHCVKTAATTGHFLEAFENDGLSVFAEIGLSARPRSLSISKAAVTLRL